MIQMASASSLHFCLVQLKKSSTCAAESGRKPRFNLYAVQIELLNFLDQKYTSGTEQAHGIQTSDLILVDVRDQNPFTDVVVSMGQVVLLIIHAGSKAFKCRSGICVEFQDCVKRLWYAYIKMSRMPFSLSCSNLGLLRYNEVQFGSGK